MSDVGFEQLDRIADALERQAEAMEDVAEEARWQSAILTEIAQTQYLIAENAGSFNGLDADRVPSLDAMYSNIDDHDYTRDDRDSDSLL